MKLPDLVVSSDILESFLGESPILKKHSQWMLVGDTRAAGQVPSLVFLRSPKKEVRANLPEGSFSVGTLKEDHFPTKDPYEVFGKIIRGAYPEIEKLHGIGITGTNGKTTTSYLVRTLLQALGKKVCLMGTVGTWIGEDFLPSTHTTPDPIALSKILVKSVSLGIEHVVMEVSSHGLDQNRTSPIRFEAAGFTNLSQDHLDYHHDLESYFHAKEKLFTHFMKSNGVGVIMDSPWGLRLSEELKKRKITHTMITQSFPKGVGVFQCLKADPDGFMLAYRGAKFRFPMLGLHNLENWALAVSLVSAVENIDSLEWKTLKFEPVSGRAQVIHQKDERVVMVDYAHTPDGLEKILETLKLHFPRFQIAVVFGAGGDRDPSKRKAMGEVVYRRADKIWITNDNPRFEDPLSIAEMIREGAPTADIELDRESALKNAVTWLRLQSQRIILVAGKGHEQGISIKGQVFPFSDVDVLQKVLNSEN